MPKLALANFFLGLADEKKNLVSQKQ